MSEIYKKGSKGDIVKQIQIALNIEADGIFGNTTENEVRKFQKSNGLIADGIVGRQTLDLLLYKNIKNKMIQTQKPTWEDYFLPKTEYINGVYKNEYIILHHTAGNDNPKQVVDDWSHDSAGRVATEFVIGGQNCSNGRTMFDGKIVHSYPEGNQAYHIGKCGSSQLSLHAVGIEMCNMGWVKNGKTYVNSIVKPDQIIKLKEPFRGYTDWHKYSDKQLQSLKELLLYISKRDNIDLHKGLYEWIKKEGVAKAFEFHQDAYMGIVKGIYTHANIRPDKFDVSPQPELVDLILSL